MRGSRSALRGLVALAAVALGASAASAGWPASRVRVERLLSSEVRDDREAGLALLWELGDDAARPFLENALRSEHLEVRLGAARRAEFAHASFDFSLVRPLVESATSEEQEAGLSLVRGALGEEDIAPVERALGAMSPEVRRRAVAVLAVWGSRDRARALAALRKALVDSDEGVRVEALGSLVWVGGVEASALAERGLDDSNERVRVAAARSTMVLEPRFPRAEALLSDASPLVRAVAYEALLRAPGTKESERALDRLSSEADPRVWRAALRRLGRYRAEESMRDAYRRLVGPMSLDRSLDLLEVWSRFGDERGAVVAKLLAEAPPETWPFRLGRLAERRDARIEGALLEAHRQGRVPADALAAYLDRTKSVDPEVLVLGLEALDEGSTEPETWLRILDRAPAVPPRLVEPLVELTRRKALSSEVRRGLLRLLVGSSRAVSLGTPMLASTDEELRALGSVLRLSVPEGDWETEFRDARSDAHFRAEFERAVPRLSVEILLRAARGSEPAWRSRLLDGLATRVELGGEEVEEIARFSAESSRDEWRRLAPALAHARCDVRLPEIARADAFVRLRIAALTGCTDRLFGFESDPDPLVRALGLQRLAQLPLSAATRARAVSWWNKETSDAEPAVTRGLALLAAGRQWALSSASLPWISARRSLLRFAELGANAADGPSERQVLLGEADAWTLAVHPSVAARSEVASGAPHRGLSALERCEDFAVDEALALRCGLVLDHRPFEGAGMTALGPEEVVVRSRGGAPLRDQPLLVVDAFGRPWLDWSDERGRVRSPAGRPSLVDSRAAY